MILEREIEKRKIGKCEKNIPIKKITTYKAGGIASLIVTPKNRDKLLELLKLLNDKNIKYKILGNGSNLLFSDKVYDGVLIKLSELNECEIDDTVIKVGAGYSLIALSIKASKLGLTGMEFATGIPGTVGGAVYMNAGAYGGEMKNVVKTVRAIDEYGRIYELDSEKMDFSYRHSIVEERKLIVLEVTLELEHGSREAINDRMKELAEARRSKQPLEYPSAGSTFKRPEGYFAGKLIMDAGLRGYSVGGAQVAEKHCGFVINKGGATASDVVELIRDVQHDVDDKFGVTLEPEVKMLGEF